MPRYWVEDEETRKRLPAGFKETGFIGFRNIARSTDERTMIISLLPLVAVGHSMPIVFSRDGRRLQGAWTSFIVDWVLRQKLGGTNLAYNYMQQLPMPLPAVHLHGVDASWVGDRVDRLNTWMANPFEREQVRSDLDAYHFHLYGLTRDEVEYVMGTFPIVKRKDEAEHGSYRTKELILAAYDRLAKMS